MIDSLNYAAVIIGYITMVTFASVVLFAVLYILYWCVLIPLHTSIMFNKAYRMHRDSDSWTDEYKLMKFKVLRMWFRGMKRPFNNHNATIYGSLITIDYTGRFPRTTIVK